ncbi:hypothetical protein DKX38_001993 [Salix brachista]|uniref:Uncharacterized protein n=1 Tax=Salix brachista TaxID=2182728 RepID=A0A5N5NKS9_9ROSI|nr:hypothetical protein DKX38_001993 [Salix brachista]
MFNVPSSIGFGLKIRGCYMNINYCTRANNKSSVVVQRLGYLAFTQETRAQLSIVSSSNWMCMDENIPAIPIPGPCAVVAALSASGLATDEFTFCIYLFFNFLCSYCVLVYF